ncbi:MAG TPA: VWA domain-containing protein [Vicinamibacterales bacterium]|nr:VWA domain-containing protein [Vicinamibacterales bacterium]
MFDFPTPGRLFTIVVLAAGAAVAVPRAHAPHATTPPQAQQPQQPVFRTGVETVAIYASVLDRYGELVTNLTEDDFEVLDEGQRQTLTLFVNTYQPITATLLIDSSASMTLNLERATAAAEQFLIRLLPEDRARVGSFADKVRWATELTGDRDELLRGLRENLDVGNPTQLWDAIDETRRALASTGGRRVLLLFTDGNDTASRMPRANLFEELRADEVMVYVVQFPQVRWPDIERSLYQVALSHRGPASERPARTAREAARRVTDHLFTLSSQTGGGHIVLTRLDDLNATFTQVIHELHHQYLMAFTPQRRDGRIHNLEVRARSGTTVRARRSYLAPRATGDQP